LNKTGDGTRILVVTEHDNYKEALKSVQKAGAHDFMAKRDLDPDNFEQCIDKLRGVLSECTVGEACTDIRTAKVALLAEHDERDMATSVMITKLKGKADAKSLSEALLMAYNKMLPLLKLKGKNKGLQWDDTARAYVGEYWSRGIGSGITISVGAESTAQPNPIYRRTKGVPVAVWVTDRPRTDFETM
jgi:hypothetical protein